MLVNTVVNHIWKYTQTQEWKNIHLINPVRVSATGGIWNDIWHATYSNKKNIYVISVARVSAGEVNWQDMWKPTHELKIIHVISVVRASARGVIW